MRTTARLIIVALMVAVMYPATGYGFLLGEPTNGVKFKKGESDLKVRIRLQPRLDFGEIVKNAAGSAYSTEMDLYLRRVRLEMSGHLVKGLKYNLTFDADKWSKTGHADSVNLYYAYLSYSFSPLFNLEFGKHKLPYSRVSLTSSSKQLIIERPASTEKAKKLFGPSHAFYQPFFKAYGKLYDGVVSYAVGFGDGWQSGDTLYTSTTRTVETAGTLFAGRVELSPRGWIEKKKMDSHLGKGRHFALGLHYAQQHSIEYKENAYSEDRTLKGFDISAHKENITIQFEYNTWEIDSNDPAIGTKEPEGWYVQAGYYIPGYDVEPAIRYEEYDQDSNSSDKKEKITTVGANWYLMGHSMKLSFNWVHTEFDKKASGWLTDDDSTDVFQFQGQLYY